MAIRKKTEETSQSKNANYRDWADAQDRTDEEKLNLEVNQKDMNSMQGSEDHLNTLGKYLQESEMPSIFTNRERQMETQSKEISQSQRRDTLKQTEIAYQISLHTKNGHLF